MMVRIQDSIEYVTTLKSVFVEHQLAKVIKTINPSIQSVNYEAVKNADGSDIQSETVIIGFQGGAERQINVTKDSHLEIAQNVLRETQW